MSDDYDIDEISAASPDMSDGEMSALKDSIATIGQQVPILVWRGRVVDGRKRLAACKALNVEPRVTTLADSDSPETFASALNLLRTHYTPSQRAMFAERLASADRSIAAKAWRAKETGTLGNSVMFPPTQTEAAKTLGVHLSAVTDARLVRRNAAPEVVSAVESGHLTLHAAKQIATKVPHDSQAQVVEEVVRDAKGKRNSTSKIINAAAPGHRLPPRRDITQTRERALRTIRGCCTALDQFMDAPFADDFDYDEWQQHAAESISILRKLTRLLEKSRERSA